MQTFKLKQINLTVYCTVGNHFNHDRMEEFVQCDGT